VWLVAAVVSIVLAGALLADSLTTESNFVRTPESQRAIDLMKQRLGREEPVRDVVIIRSPTQTVSDPGFRARVEAIHNQLAAAAEDQGGHENRSDRECRRGHERPRRVPGAGDWAGHAGA
jgi:hypothetical protein